MDDKMYGREAWMEFTETVSGVLTTVLSLRRRKRRQRKLMEQSSFYNYSNSR